jgi:hypothetical protein
MFFEKESDRRQVFRLWHSGCETDKITGWQNPKDHTVWRLATIKTSTLVRHLVKWITERDVSIYFFQYKPKCSCFCHLRVFIQYSQHVNRDSFEDSNYILYGQRRRFKNCLKNESLFVILIPANQLMTQVMSGALCLSLPHISREVTDDYGMDQFWLAG